MGVLCDLAVKEGILPKPTKKRRAEDADPDDAIKVQYGSTKMTAVLPTKVRDWAGLTTSQGDYRHTALTKQNDDGKTFKQIAKIIESKPEGLFKEKE